MTDLSTPTTRGLAECPIELLTILYRNPHLDLDDRSNLIMTSSHLYHAGTEIVPNNVYIVQTPEGTTTRHESPHSTRSSKRATILLQANDQGEFPSATDKTLRRARSLIKKGDVVFEVKYSGVRPGELSNFIACGLRDTLSAQSVPTLFTFQSSNLFYYRCPSDNSTESGEKPVVFLGPVKRMADQNWPDLREMVLGTILDPDTGLSSGTGCVLIWDKNVDEDTRSGVEKVLMKDIQQWARSSAGMREGSSYADRLRDIETDVRGSVDFASFEGWGCEEAVLGMEEGEAGGIRASAERAGSKRRTKRRSV